MTKVIDGKKYNTESAKLLGVSESGAAPGDFEYWQESLYLTKSGNYFLHGKGGARTRYAESSNGNWSSGEKIIPLALDAAQEWVEEHLSADAYEAIFGEVDEDKVKISADVLQSTKNAIDALKNEKFASVGEAIDYLVAQGKPTNN